MAKRSEPEARRNRAYDAAVAYALLSQTDRWLRSIRKVLPEVKAERMRDGAHRVVGMRLYADPFVTDPASAKRGWQAFDDLHAYHRRVETIAAFCGVADDERPQACLPPAWLRGEALMHFFAACRREGPKGVSVARFGPRLDLTHALEGGGRWTTETREVLVWSRILPGQPPSVQAFRYLTPRLIDADDPQRALLARAFADWNVSMHVYVERERIRPDKAREKLASLNRELHRTLIEGFSLSKRPVRGGGRTGALAVGAAKMFSFFFRTPLQKEAEERLERIWQRRFIEGEPVD